MMTTLGIILVNDENMTYWKIAPGERADNWDIQRDNGYIGIGWPQLANILECTNQEYDRRRAEQARLLKRKAFDGHRNVWTFIHSIATGDIVVANRGIHLIVGIGIVTGDAKYILDDNSEHPNRRAVDWKYINNEGLPLPSGQFTQATLTKLSNPSLITLSQALLSKRGILFDQSQPGDRRQQWCQLMDTSHCLDSHSD